jgi:ABC-type polar amino acid transport system ATPase subunit
MKIRKIRFKNGFKRFHDLTINLESSSAKIVALVGPNGCGKSGVFDGMMLLQNRYYQIGRHGAGDLKDYSMHGSSYNPEDIEINFDQGSYQSIWGQKSGNGNGGTIFSFRGPNRYNSDLNVRTLTAIPDIKQNQNGASKSRDLDDKMEQNYQRLWSYMDHQRRANNRTDKSNQKIILGELNKILKNCLNIEIAHEGNIQSGMGSLYFKKDDQPKEFEFNVLSSGEKEVVDILLDLYLKREAYNDTIFIIDEPELHLSTAIQRSLLIEIEKLIPENCQLWISTHSIGFLRALKEELSDKSDIIYFEGSYAKEEKELKPIAKSRDNWQKIFATALEDMTSLLAPNRIVYCEGERIPEDDGKEKGFDAKVYNKIFSITKPDTLFVSSGGGKQLDRHSSIALTVLSKAFQGVELLLLKDKDINRDGTLTTDTQRKEWINENSATRRMLKRKEIENYLLDFEIFSKKYPNVSQENYDKVVAKFSDLKSAANAMMQELCHIKSGKMTIDDFKLDLATEIVEGTNVYKELYDCIFTDLD